MKRNNKIIILLLCVVLALPLCLTACGDKPTGPGADNKPEHVDYAGQAKLDFTSETKKQEVTVRLYVDGDTTHFDPVSGSKLTGCNNSADFSVESAPTKGYAKARYLAINTPESTGQIEPFGHAASVFTRSKLEKAKSIVIESDDGKWNIDSTGTRYLLWVWYIPEGETEYRNLNLDILQAGLAYNSNAAENRYGEYAMKALTQAEEEKLYVFSGEKDPDYYYGGPINIDLKELRFNTADYAGKKIVVEGTVVANFDNSAYIETTYYDIEGYEETGIRIGMPVYYSFTTGKVLEILSTGNKVSVVGVVQFYETGGFYQITDIKTYNRYKPDDPNNCTLIETVGLDNSFALLDAAAFDSTEKSVVVEIDKKDEEGKDIVETVKMTYPEALLGTSVTVADVYVYDSYTTKKEDSNSKGAMTLYCRTADGIEIQVRTTVLTDKDGNLITSDAYMNKTITVKGIVEMYEGTYQIKCHRADYITVVGD